MEERFIRDLLTRLGLTKADINRHIRNGVIVYKADDYYDFINSLLIANWDNYIEEARKIWDKLDSVYGEDGHLYKIEFIE